MVNYVLWLFLHVSIHYICSIIYNLTYFVPRVKHRGNIGLGEKWKGISSLKRSSVMKTGILFLALYIWHILQKTLQRLI